MTFSVKKKKKNLTVSSAAVMRAPFICQGNAWMCALVVLVVFRVRALLLVSCKMTVLEDERADVPVPPVLYC